MRKLPLSLFFLLITAHGSAQEVSRDTSPGGFYSRWETRTNAIQSKQPGWAVPLVTTYTGLFQVVRTDILRQTTPTLTHTWNFDNSKGVNMILSNRTEVAINLPPYIQHNSTAKDGAGDMSFLGKVRIASGNAQHGTYTLCAFAIATIPTGSYKNGSTDASIAPSLGAGKGFGHFDVQSTIGATLPTGNPAITTAGRPIAWNTAAQYHIGKLFWPEVESNATSFKGGTNDGKTQEFLTPGLIVGKCGLHPTRPGSRPGLAFGAGMQIATSQFHTYNHELILTARWIY
ncbi:MAG: hypothetical protein ABR905_13740 [Terracidiphilus sp.]|jgi:hypothetical protein